MIVSSKTVRKTNSPGAKPSIAPSNSTVVAVRFIYPTCVMSQSGILSLSSKSHGYSSHVIGVSTTFMVTNSPGESGFFVSGHRTETFQRAVFLLSHQFQDLYGLVNHLSHNNDISFRYGLIYYRRKSMQIGERARS